ASGRLPERLGCAMAARLRPLVSERNHVPDPEPAPPARTSGARRSPHLRHRRNARSADRRPVPIRDGSHTGGPGGVWRGPASTGARRLVAKFAASAAEWNSFILLRLLIRSLHLPPVVLAAYKGV